MIMRTLVATSGGTPEWWSRGPELRRAGSGSDPGSELQLRSLSLPSLTESQIVNQIVRQSPQTLALILFILFQTLLILF